MWGRVFPSACTEQGKKNVKDRAGCPPKTGWEGWGGAGAAGGGRDRAPSCRNWESFVLPKPRRSSSFPRQILHARGGEVGAPQELKPREISASPAENCLVSHPRVQLIPFPHPALSWTGRICPHSQERSTTASGMALPGAPSLDVSGVPECP